LAVRILPGPPGVLKCPQTPSCSKKGEDRKKGEEEKGERGNKKSRWKGSIKGNLLPPTKGARRPWPILAAR